MPQGSEPPTPKLTESVFDTVSAMSYNSSKRAFESSGVYYSLFVDRESGGPVNAGEWFAAKEGQGNKAPWGYVPQGTYDIISGGTWDDYVIDYSGNSYRISLVYNSTNGDMETAAVVV